MLLGRRVESLAKVAQLPKYGKQNITHAHLKLLNSYIKSNPLTVGGYTIYFNKKKAFILDLILINCNSFILLFCLSSDYL